MTQLSAFKGQGNQNKERGGGTFLRRRSGLGSVSKREGGRLNFLKKKRRKIGDGEMKKNLQGLVQSASLLQFTFCMCSHTFQIRGKYYFKHIVYF